MPSSFEITPKSPDKRNRTPRYASERPLSSTHASQEKIESLEAQNARIREQLRRYDHDVKSEMRAETRQRRDSIMENMLAPAPGDEDERDPDYFHPPAGAFSGDTHQYHGIHSDERSPWAINNAQEHTFTGHGGKKIDHDAFAPPRRDPFRAPTQPIPLEEQQAFINETEGVFGAPTNVDTISDPFSDRDGDTLVARNPFAEKPSERPNALRGATEPWKKPAQQSPSLQERMAAFRKDSGPSPFDSPTEFDRAPIETPFIEREAMVPPAPNPELLRKGQELNRLEAQAKNLEALVTAKTKGFQAVFDADPGRAVANSLGFGERLMLGLNRGVFGMRGNILTHEANINDLLSPDFFNQKRAYSQIGPKQALEDWKKYNDESITLFGQISDLKKEIAQLQKGSSAPKNPYAGHELRQRFAQRDHIPNLRRDQRIFSGQELPPLPNQAEQLNQRFERAFADRGISIDEKNRPDEESLRERLWFMNEGNNAHIDADEVAERYRAYQEEKKRGSRNTLSIEPMPDQETEENTVPDFVFQPTERQSSPIRPKTIDSGPPKGKIFAPEEPPAHPPTRSSALRGPSNTRASSLNAMNEKQRAVNALRKEKISIRKEQTKSLNQLFDVLTSFLSTAEFGEEISATIHNSFTRYYKQRQAEALNQDLSDAVSADSLQNFVDDQHTQNKLLEQMLTFVSGRIDNFDMQADSLGLSRGYTFRKYVAGAITSFIDRLTIHPETNAEQLENLYIQLVDLLNKKGDELLSSARSTSRQST